MFHFISLQVGTPNPAQINPWSNTRFGGGLDPILLSRDITDQSMAMSLASSIEDSIKP